MGINDNGRYVIPFLFKDRSVVLKVTKYTTCDDVIEMILRKEGVGSSPSLFKVCERSSGVERDIPGRSLVVKILRSWGCESKNFQFIIRRQQTPPRAKTSLQLKQFSSEANIDAMFVKQHQRNNVSGYKQTPVNNSISQPRRSNMNYADLSPSNESSRPNDRNASLLSTSKKTLKKSKCSSFILSRFFKDILKTTRRRKRVKKCATRERGVGAENTLSTSSRYGDGAEEPDVSLTSTLHARCQYVWDKYNTCDSDTDSEVSGDNSTDDISLDEESFIHFSDTNNGQSNLNKAFIGTSPDSDSDEGIDVTSMTSSSVDLDTAFVGDLELSKQVRSTSESIERSSDYTTVDRFEVNISDDEFVRGLFGYDGDECEDDEMDSFMRSILEDSF